MPKLIKNLKRIESSQSKNSVSKSKSSSAHPYNDKKKSNNYRFKLRIEEEESVLFVGEGNMSFAVSLAYSINRADNFWCSVYDSKEILVEKYENDVEENLAILTDMEATILFNVDATKLHSNVSLKQKKFSKIIFNFPHVGLGIKDQAQNIKANQLLISSFFESAKRLLEPNGQILVTLKLGDPYDQWKIKELARENLLQVHRSFEFVPADYPGYAHRRTIGFDAEKSAAENEEIIKKSARSYIFTRTL